MEPTIRNGSNVICLNTTGELTGLEYMATNTLAKEGTIIIATDPEEPGLIVKRIKKIEGESVFWRKIMNSITIPQNHVWVEGDNLHASGN